MGLKLKGPFHEPPRKRSPLMISAELGEGVLLSMEMV